MRSCAGAGRPGPRNLRTRRTLPFLAPVLLVAAVLLWEWRASAGGAHLVPLLAAAPAVAAVGTGRRRCVAGSGVCAVAALYPAGRIGSYEQLGGRAGVFVAILSVLAAGCVVSERRRRLKGELARVREVADAAQRALLRPLPSRLEGLTLAAGHLSASRDAAIGGDLYDVVATPYGVRVVMGDVRGHGLEAVGTVAAVLGSFREAAHDEPRLGGVLRRLERGLFRQQGDSGEEFVTVQLLELRPDGTVTMYNCGHPWPYRLSAPGRGPLRAEPVGESEPLPPLGLFPLPARLPEPLRLRLGGGETLFLFTDGAEDARDAHGGYFGLEGALNGLLAGALPPAPGELVDAVRAALLRHTGGDFTDDVALLALRNDCTGVPGRFTASLPLPAAVPEPYPQR